MMQFRSAAILCAAIVGVASAQAANVAFSVNYTDGAGEGFYDPTLGSSRQSAFQFALGIWSNYLQASYAGETIHVNAAFDPLGGTSTSATLGQAGNQYIWSVGGTQYGDSLANHQLGYDISDANVGPNTAEIVAQFNSDVDGSVLGATNWYYGTNGTAGSNVDFVTVVLHEFGHGLNFSDTVNRNTGAWLYGGQPGAYDRFLWDAATGKRFDDPTMTNRQRKAALTSSNVFWDGQYGKDGNGGIRPEIYAPNPYESGSSISHLDEATYPNELMSPMYSGPDHVPGAIELGMLRDMGWTLVPEPGFAATAIAISGLAALRRKQRTA